MLSSESPQNSYYGLANKSSKGGVVTREYTEVHSQQWVNQSAGNVATDPLDRSSAVFGGNDSQQDDSSKKRRNKKRRDPEYYKSYWERVQGSVDHDSGAENGSVREDSKYGGTGEYMPPSGSTEQDEYQSEAAAAPTPSYEYNADEKSTGRTSSYNMESVYQSTDYVPPRTANVSDDQQIKSDSHEESVPLSGSVIMPAVEMVNIGDGNVNDAPANTEQGNSIASSVPPVPIIHISPSESTSPNVQSGDSFDESFPAATAEGFGGPKRAAAPPSAAPPAAKSWASLFKGGSAGQPGQTSSAPYVAISVSSDPLPGEELDDGSVSLVTTDKDPHAKRLGGKEHFLKKFLLGNQLESFTMF